MRTFSLSSLLKFVGLLAVSIVLFGRIPFSGTLSVVQPNEKHVKSILDRNNVSSWWGFSMSGGTSFFFDYPAALKVIEGRIRRDAEKNGYWVSIEYKTLLPSFNSKKLINGEE